MVCGSHAKTRAMYSTPPCPSLATSTAAYRRRSFSDSQPKNRFIFCSTSAEYPSMPHSLIRGLLCSKDTAAQAIREVILDHILSALERIQLQVGFLSIGGDTRVADLHGAKTPKRCWFCTIPSAPEFCNAF